MRKPPNPDFPLLVTERRPALDSKQTYEIYKHQINIYLLINFMMTVQDVITLFAVRHTLYPFCHLLFHDPGRLSKNLVEQI